MPKIEKESEVMAPPTVADQSAFPKNYDVILAVLANVMSSAGVSFDITLVVGGTIVSGTVISAREHFETLGELFSDAWQQTGARFDWSDVFGMIGEKASPLHPEDQSRIHLKNVTIVGPGEARLGTPLWRGLLSHVGGWSLGQPDFK